jgi:hypothetical protein
MRDVGDGAFCPEGKEEGKGRGEGKRGREEEQGGKGDVAIRTRTSITRVPNSTPMV